MLWLSVLRTVTGDDEQLEEFIHLVVGSIQRIKPDLPIKAQTVVIVWAMMIAIDWCCIEH